MIAKLMNRLKTIAGLLFSLTVSFSNTTHAQMSAPSIENPNIQTLTSQSLDQKLGIGWTGILFICDPYCRLISIREKSNWNPPLPSNKVDFTLLKSVAKSDPLYPLFVKSLDRDSGESSEDPLKKERIVTKEGATAPPAYANSKFNFGYNLSVGFKSINTKLKSDTEIQSKLNNSISSFAPSFAIGLMKGNPIYFFNQYWQLKFEYLSNSAAQANLKSTNEKIQYSSTSIKLGSFIMRETYKPYIGIAIDKNIFLAPSESLSLFSSTATRNYLDLGIALGRFYMEISYPLSTQISDKQGFRTSPLTDSTLSAKIRFHSKEVNAFDFSFGYTLEAGITNTKQSSAVNSQIISIEKSNIQQNDYHILALLRFGEDFFQ